MIRIADLQQLATSMRLRLNDLRFATHTDVALQLQAPDDDVIGLSPTLRFAWLVDRPDDPPLEAPRRTLFPEVLPYVQTRVRACEVCNKAQAASCTACGCRLIDLQKDPDASCPLGKWGVHLGA